jgi:hypothetical protein
MPAGQTGPPAVAFLDNNGRTDEEFNANVTRINNTWIYGNTGVKLIFDVTRSRPTSTGNREVKAKGVATVLIPGTLTTMPTVRLGSDGEDPLAGRKGSDSSSRAVRLTGN